MQSLSSINSSNMVGLARNNPSKTAVVFNGSNDRTEIVLQREQWRLMPVMIGHFFQIIVVPEIP